MTRMQTSNLLALAGCLAAAPLLFAQPQEAVAEDPVPAEASQTIEAADSILPVYRAELNRPAPHFTLKDTDGKTWKLADLKGQTVVLEWYNPDCPVVRKAHGPDGSLHSLGNRIHNMEGATWLAINSGAAGMQGHGLDRNRESRKQYSLDYPVLLDESGATGKAYQATTTPQMYVIDKNGILMYMGAHEDRKSGENLVATAITAVMQGKKPEQQRTGNFGCSVKYPTEATLGAVAPAFELKSLAGKSFKLDDLAGKIVVLEWFNPHCPVVVEAHKDGPLRTAAADLTRSGQVVWLAINSAHAEHESANSMANQLMAKEYNITNPILMDSKGRVGQAYGATVTPQMFVIDPQGVLVYQGHPGDAKNPMVQSIVTKMLRGETVKSSETQAEGCTVKYAPKKGKEAEEEEAGEDA